MSYNDKKVAILLLAAGSSSRLGRPKQLVNIKGQSLLNRITETALASGCQPVVVVLGAYFENIKPVIENLPVNIVKNNNWESGMGSSIACGMNFLANIHSKPEAVILLVCDQYHLSTETIHQLIETWEKTGKNIIAAAYGNTTGVPALFSEKFFPALATLTGKTGAKKVISANEDEVALINFEKGIFDLDTENDLKGLI